MIRQGAKHKNGQRKQSLKKESPPRQVSEIRESEIIEHQDRNAVTEVLEKDETNHDPGSTDKHEDQDGKDHLSVLDKVLKDNPFLVKMWSGKIFRNGKRDLLRSDYIPEVLPHREKEINQIVSILATAMDGDQPSNIFIYGSTGTGKTSVMLIVQRKIEEIEHIMINQGLRPMKMVYVNCRLHDTKYTLLSHIGNQLVEDSIPTGWPTEKVYSQLLKNLDRTGATIILVLDEVSALVEKSGDDALYLLSRINPDLKRSRLTIASITNNPQAWNILNPSVRSTLTPEDVYFESYNADQLRDILTARARFSFMDGALSTGIISRCAAIAAMEQGDARIALELLRKSGEIAERQGAETVEEHHIVSAHKAIETSKVTSVIRGLLFHSKAVLLSIYAHIRSGFKRVSTGNVYDVYCKICGTIGKPPLTQRRISDLISELDMLGIAQSLVISKGRYGRTKEIKLAASMNDVRQGMADDEDFCDLLEIEINQRTF